MSEPGRLPNFVIIGAMKCGTTSLARYLGGHPDVFMAPEKELHFFDSAGAGKTLDWYRQKFRDADDAGAVGEATPLYMYEEGAVRRMAETLPDARLIAILRNPVDRAYSHYWHSRARGRESLSFPEALAAEDQRLASGDSFARRFYSYADRGRYRRQLARVCEYYSRTSLHVMLFEDLLRAPAESYQTVCRFLSVDETFMPPNLGARMNRFVVFRSPRLRDGLKRLPPAAAPITRLIGRLNTTKGSYPRLSPQARREIGIRFREENEALEKWLGMDLSLWDEERVDSLAR